MNQKTNTSEDEGTPNPTGNDNPEQNNGGQGNPEQNPQGEKTPPQKTFTQEEVNAIVAAERRKGEERANKLKDAGLSDEQIKLINDREEIERGKQELELIRKGKVDAILEKHKDLVTNLDAAQVEKLKSGSPDKVEDFLSGLSSIVEKAKGGSGQDGDMPSINKDANPNSLPSDVAALAEGIDSGVKTGNWGKAINSLFGNLIK